MSSPLPTLQYLVAFQNGPMDDPATVTTVATPAGTLGAANQWTDITPWVDSHRISRGRQHELQQFEAGTCELHLNNVDGRWNPWNTSSPYNGFLLPRKLMQVRATWSGTTYTRFTGHVDAWPVEWPDPISGWASLHATDAFRMFNLNNVVSTQYPAQVIADGAVGYWRLGDPVGYFADSSGNNHPASPNPNGGSLTLSSTEMMVADSNPSTQFDCPANNSGAPEIVANTGPTLTTSTGISVEWWMQLSSGDTTTHAGVQVPFTLSGTAYQLTAEYFSGFLTVTSAGGSHPTYNFGFNLADGNPHHVVVTVDSSWNVTAYIDGSSQGSQHSISWVTAAQSGMFAYAYTVDTSAHTANFQDWAVYPSVLSSGAVNTHHSLATIPIASTDRRIGEVLDIVGWSAGARSLDSGASIVQPVTSPLTTTSSLSHMQSVEATEGGALFMTTDGKVRFLSRQTLFSNTLYTTSQQTIGDNLAGGDMPFQPGPVIALDDIDLYNEATAARQNGATQRTTDATSITSYGRTTWQPPATLIGISDSEVLGLTQYVVNKFKTPTTRIQAVTVDLLELITPNLVAHLLTLDLLYRVTVERTSPPGGGTGFTQIANIEHIDEQVTPDSWQVTFGLAIADPAWWILGTSQLGSTTRVAF